MSYPCVDHCDKYVNRHLDELQGYSDGYKVREAVFYSFNHLSVYFPQAYKHILKVWGVENENN